MSRGAWLWQCANLGLIVLAAACVLNWIPKVFFAGAVIAYAIASGTRVVMEEINRREQVRS